MAAQAANDQALLCETATAAAERAESLPSRLLHAISLVETGRFDAEKARVRPWPWSVNAAGEGHWYETKGDAIAAVEAFRRKGVQSIDVGCMQVNLMFHPEAFSSLDEAFDPTANARYAAKYLVKLRGADSDWTRAIGAYHSETPAFGDPYRALVMLRWGSAGPAPTDRIAFK